MTKFLIKRFVGSGDLNEETARTKCGNLASIVGMVTNTCLFVVKLIIGILLNSVSIMADAVNNITDSLANIMVIVGIRLAKKPADYNHPFGHAKIEYISSFIIAGLMLLLGFEFIQSSISAIINPEEMGFDIVLVIILAASGLVKLWQSGFYHKLGKSTSSEPLIALSKDSLNDVIIAVAIVGSVIFAHITGINIDGYIGVIISLIILYSGFTVARDTITKLIGESVEYKDAIEIINMVKAYDNIIDAHDLVVHNYGPSNNMATVHVDMCDTLSFKEVHDIVSKMERDAKEKRGIDLLIRADARPHDHNLDKIRMAVELYISNTDERLSADDFRIIEKEGIIDVIFDLELPYDYDDSRQRAVILDITREIKALDERYNPIIEKERGFVKYKPI